VGAGGGGAGGAEGSGGNRSVWLGNLPYGITEEELRAEFAPYGMLRDVKILTQKNCAFLHYFDPADAERALMAARGKRLRGQEIRVGWGKPDPAEGRERDERTGDGNPPSRNLWVGNLHPNVTEELLHQTFSPFGRIEHIKLLHQKNCAFILMSSMEEATNARRTMMGRELLGRPLRINYGKQDGPPGRQGIGAQSFAFIFFPFLSFPVSLFWYLEFVGDVSCRYVLFGVAGAAAATAAAAAAAAAIVRTRTALRGPSRKRHSAPNNRQIHRVSAPQRAHVRA
jgi:RNA recognition motif-containing protein